ncbi:MAG: M48 family metalloprotease [Planctomycetes bacterium]|nr:M48 family metalloprotease [Planctomycetota bacterium]
MIDGGFIERALNATLVAAGDLVLIWFLVRGVRIRSVRIRGTLHGLAIAHAVLAFFLLSPLRVFFVQLDYDPRVAWYPAVARLDAAMWSVWALVAFALAAIRIARGRRFHRVIANLAGLSAPPQPPLLAALEDIAARAGVAAPALTLLDLPAASPFILGWRRPVLVFPSACCAMLTPDETRSVLAHEVAHLRAADPLVNVALDFLRTVFFFNAPLAALIRGLRRETERVRDAAACRMTRSTRPLATALLKILEASPAPPSLPAGAASSHFMQFGFRSVRERLAEIGGAGRPADPRMALVHVALCVLIVPWQPHGGANAADAAPAPRFDRSEHGSLVSLGLAAAPNPIVAGVLHCIWKARHE